MRAKIKVLHVEQTSITMRIPERSLSSRISLMPSTIYTQLEKENIITSTHIMETITCIVIFLLLLSNMPSTDKNNQTMQSCTAKKKVKRCFCRLKCLFNIQWRTSVRHTLSIPDHFNKDNRRDMFEVDNHLQ